MPVQNNLTEEIKSRLDIVDVISDYLSLKKTGQNWKGLCPFHSEKTPSFMVSSSKQIFHCFGCGIGGNIFDFLMKYEGLSFKESLQSLAKKAGIEINKSQRRHVEAGEKEAMLNAHRDAAVFYQQNLQKHSKAVEYFKKRGIKDQALKQFSLGYAPDKWDALCSHLKRRGYTPALMKKAGLVVQGQRGLYDTFRNRILFPLSSLSGDVIAFGGRVMDDSMPKYLNSPDSPVFSKGKILYGLNLAKESIRKTGYVIFVEGYLDVIAAHMHGFTNTVAPLGTALTQEHGKLIKRFAQNAILVFDGDPSGRRAAKSSINILFESAVESGLNVRILLLPEGEDPDSFLLHNGKEAFSDLLKRAVNLVDFFVMQEGDKKANAQEAIEIISRIPNSVTRGEFVKLLSEKLGIREFFIMEEMQKERKRHLFRNKPRQYTRTTDREITQIPRNKASVKPTEELYLIQLVLQCPDKAERILEHIFTDDVVDPVIKSVFHKMKSGVIDYNSLIADSDENGRSLLTELLFKNTFEDPEKILEDCLRRLKSKKRQMILNELQEKIKKAELDKDRELLKKLLFKKQELLRLKG
jgi:DNA primase